MLQLIKKEDIRFVGGRLVDKDGKVVTPKGLAYEVNELAELREFVDFIKANAPAIEASAAGSLVFEPTKIAETPAFKSGKVVPTPLNDKHKAQAEARAKEFLDAQIVKDVDQHLLRYARVAKFLTEDYIEFDGEVSSAPFLVDPLTMTEQDVVSIVEEYHEPSIFRLGQLVTIKN